jgi:hypothetical protein
VGIKEPLRNDYRYVDLKEESEEESGEEESEEEESGEESSKADE